MEKSSDYITIKDAATILGCSWNLVRNHIVPNVDTVRVGRKIMIREKSFREYLKRLECGA